MTVKCALSSNCDPNNRWNPKCDINWHLTIRKKRNAKDILSAVWSKYRINFYRTWYNL